MKVLVIAPQPFFLERGTPIAVRLLVTTLCGFGHTVDLLVNAADKAMYQAKQKGRNRVELYEPLG